jgi:hypothetical protein
MVSAPSQASGSGCTHQSAIQLRRLLFLHKLIQSLRDGPVISIVLLSLRPKRRRQRRLCERAGIAPVRSTTLINSVAQKCLPSNHLPRILTQHDIRPAQTAARACAQRTHSPTLLGTRPSQLSQITLGGWTPATESAAFTHETIARVALADQRLVLVSQLIPQRVKLMIMLAPLVVRELMQHSINNLLERQEEIRIVVIA